MMVLKAKVATKLYGAANVYRPTAIVQHTNDAMVV